MKHIIGYIIFDNHKPVYDEKSGQYKCPHCNSFWVCEPNIERYYNYCGQCGRPLDWGNEE